MFFSFLVGLQHQRTPNRNIFETKLNQAGKMANRKDFNMKHTEKSIESIMKTEKRRQTGKNTIKLCTKVHQRNK